MTDNVKVIQKTQKYYNNFDRVFYGARKIKTTQYRYTFIHPVNPDWVESTQWTTKSWHQVCRPVDSKLVLIERRSIEYDSPNN